MDKKVSGEELWNRFEITGSIEAYLAYSKEAKRKNKEEESGFGAYRNRGDNNQRG